MGWEAPSKTCEARQAGGGASEAQASMGLSSGQGWELGSEEEAAQLTTQSPPTQSPPPQSAASLARGDAPRSRCPQTRGPEAPTARERKGHCEHMLVMKEVGSDQTNASRQATINLSSAKGCRRRLRRELSATLRAAACLLTSSAQHALSAPARSCCGWACSAQTAAAGCPPPSMAGSARRSGGKRRPKSAASVAAACQNSECS